MRVFPLVAIWKQQNGGPYCNVRSNVAMTANVTLKSQPLACRKRELLCSHQMVIKSLCLLADKYHFMHLKDVFINQTSDLDEVYTKWLIQIINYPKYRTVFPTVRKTVLCLPWKLLLVCRHVWFVSTKDKYINY